MYTQPVVFYSQLLKMQRCNSCSSPSFCYQYSRIEQAHYNTESNRLNIPILTNMALAIQDKGWHSYQGTCFLIAALWVEIPSVSFLTKTPQQAFYTNFVLEYRRLTSLVPQPLSQGILEYQKYQRGGVDLPFQLHPCPKEMGPVKVLLALLGEN